MLKIIQKNDFIISFIPIIDNKNKLTGCITFWDLIVMNHDNTSKKILKNQRQKNSKAY